MAVTYEGQAYGVNRVQKTAKSGKPYVELTFSVNGTPIRVFGNDSNGFVSEGVAVRVTATEKVDKNTGLISFGANGQPYMDYVVRPLMSDAQPAPAKVAAVQNSAAMYAPRVASAPANDREIGMAVGNAQKLAFDAIKLGVELGYITKTKMKNEQYALTLIEHYTRMMYEIGEKVKSDPKGVVEFPSFDDKDEVKEVVSEPKKRKVNVAIPFDDDIPVVDEEI
jgi:phage tail sheath protein FI